MSDSIVPAYILGKEWREGNFLIPSDKHLRMELRLKLEQYHRYEVMLLKENRAARAALLARIAALNAYDSA